MNGSSPDHLGDLIRRSRTSGIGIRPRLPQLFEGLTRQAGAGLIMLGDQNPITADDVGAADEPATDDASSPATWLVALPGVSGPQPDSTVGISPHSGLTASISWAPVASDAPMGPETGQAPWPLPVLDRAQAGPEVARHARPRGWETPSETAVVAQARPVSASEIADRTPATAAPGPLALRGEKTPVRERSQPSAGPDPAHPGPGSSAVAVPATALRPRSSQNAGPAPTGSRSPSRTPTPASARTLGSQQRGTLLDGLAGTAAGRVHDDGTGARRRRGSAPSPGSSEATPTVKVTIGRVEVRAVVEPQAPAARRSRREGEVTLEAHLDQRNRAEGRR